MTSNVCISDIAEVVMGQSPKGEDVNEAGDGYPLLNGPTEFTARYPKPVQFTTEGRRFSEAGDILFCVRGSTTGKMNYADQKYAIGRGIATIRGKNGYPTPYVRAVIERNVDRLLASATGSTFPNVGRELLLNFEVETVSSEESLSINEMIVSLDDKIELNRQTNQTLEQIAQAIFKSWFVDFDPVKAKIKAKKRWQALNQIIKTSSPTCYAEEFETPDPNKTSLQEAMTQAAMCAISGRTEEQLKGLDEATLQQLKTTAALFPDALVESELGEIPEGWSVESFSKKAKLDTTSVKPNKEPDKMWEHYSIPAFDVDESPAHELGEEIKSNKYKVDKNAILSSKLNPHYPRTWWPYVEDKNAAICSTEFMQFIPKDSKHRTFILGMILSGPFQQGIMQRVTGSTGSRQRAQPPQVANMDVVMPSESLIEIYSGYLESFFVRKAKNIKENNTLSNLRDTLLPKLLSGELSINSEEAA